jgi:hypothetical protein
MSFRRVISLACFSHSLIMPFLFCRRLLQISVTVCPHRVRCGYALQAQGDDKAQHENVIFATSKAVTLD